MTSNFNSLSPENKELNMFFHIWDKIKSTGYESLYDIYKTRIDKVMRDFEDILQTLPE
jgi:hypothetical protein